MGASLRVRRGHEGVSGSPGAAGQDQQADGRLYAEGLQDAGGVL